MCEPASGEYNTATDQCVVGRIEKARQTHHVGGMDHNILNFDNKTCLK